MTLQKIVRLHFCVIICFAFPTFADEPIVPSQVQIPSLFESVASSYNLSTVDLNISLPVYPPSKGIDLQLNSSASQSFIGNGSISFYGSDFIRSGEKEFDFGSHQLFFHYTIGKITLGVGAGYDFDSESNVKIDENTTLNGSSVSDKNSYLLINDWEENTFSGHIDGSLIVNNEERLLFGFEMSHCIKDGIEYSETSEYSTDIYMGFQDNITYFNYDDGAYRNRLSAGTGFLREYVSKGGYERLRLASLKYQQNIEHSNLSPLYGVRSYFFSSDPDNIQFSGKNYTSRSIALDLLFSERSPDKVFLENAHKKTVEMYLKFLKFGLQYEANRKSILSINQWNMNDVYYGVNEKKSKHYPLSILVNNVTDCILFGKFRVRFDSHLEGMIERYANGIIGGRCVLECNPALGCTLPIKKTALIDINYFLFPVATGIIGNNNRFHFGWDVSFKNVLQLRIAFLK